MSNHWNYPADGAYAVVDAGLDELKRNRRTSEAPQDVAALRRLAEAAVYAEAHPRWVEHDSDGRISSTAIVSAVPLWDFQAAASPDVVLGLLDQNDRLRSALHSCGLAAHFGGELMDQRHRGGRDKLRYIEITADAALRGVPPVFPVLRGSGAEEAARDE